MSTSTAERSDGKVISSKDTKAIRDGTFRCDRCPAHAGFRRVLATCAPEPWL